MGCGKGGFRSGSGCRAYSWHDGPSYAPVWAVLGAHRVIRHTYDEDERARWAPGSRKRGGPVDIASGHAPTVLRLGRIRLSASFGGGYFLVFSWLMRHVGQPSAGVAADEGPGRTDESYATLSWNQLPVKFKAPLKRHLCAWPIRSCLNEGGEQQTGWEPWSLLKIPLRYDWTFLISCVVADGSVCMWLLEFMVINWGVMGSRGWKAMGSKRYEIQYIRYNGLIGLGL